MPFKLTKPTTASINSPEALFLDLRTRKIPGLLAHQADVLREYVDSAIDEGDVAFQLPTGSGKTLVGLLLGEWRRRKFEERVVYLCPTNQLVNQVAEQARLKYGLKVHGFTRKKSDYDQRSKSEYLNGESIAITSYSGIFNVNPFFNDPHIIILDDAHSAENYISSLWSVKIDRFRSEHETLFTALVSLLKDSLSITDYHRLTSKYDASWDKNWVEKLSTPLFHSLIPELLSTIDTHATDPSVKFSWGLIRDHLQACQLYVGTREILIRPLIPPTDTHSPFSKAKQRVYMSATLGEGGELERLTGRRRIKRLQLPSGWDKQGIGRRLFFFPGRSLNEAESETVILRMMQKTGRTLVIVPDDQTAERFRDTIKQELGFPTFDAREIEQSKGPFVSKHQAVAVVSNRYDGIDFLENECRLLVIEGVPQATNLQERFIISKMGAVALLNDRIMTRIQQAFGRCTRSATDYAAIVVAGEDLNTYLVKKDRRDFLHPELQAELQFGIEQSKDILIDGFLENLTIFLQQDDEWNAADEEIVSIRQRCTQKILPGTEDLQKAAAYEVEYQYALWREDFPRALESARKIIAELNHPELQGYRALWNYLAGSAAWLGSKAGFSGLDGLARSFYGKARAAAPAIRWLASLAHTQQSEGKAASENPYLLIIIERLEQVLDKMGVLTDRRFAEEEKFILTNIREKDSTKFEAAHERIGHLLGFEAGNKESTGAPDPWWLVDDDLCFIFEDHSEGDSNSSLYVNKARQAASHPNWVRANLPVKSTANILAVLITPVSFADIDAIPHLNEVYVWHLEDFRNWVYEALTVIRELRRTFPGSGDLNWRKSAAEKYVEHGLDPSSILRILKTKPAAKILKPPIKA